MAKKKAKKAKAAKKGKPVKKKAKSAKKKASAKKATSKKKPATKKAAKKKVVAKKGAKKAVKKAVAKKVSARKAVSKKKVGKKAPIKKIVAKKPLNKVSKPVAKKPAAPKPAMEKAPEVHRDTHVEKKEVQKEAPIVQQEAHGGEHKESFTPHITHLKAGDRAPNFSGVDQHGNHISLDDFRGKTLVLYFYPKDDTDGCTAESCSLRDEYSYITSQNHAVVGVSADDVESHKKFADKYSLPFPLIADTNMGMIHAYDVWGKKRLFDHIYDGIVRTTFIIRDGIIQRVITSVNTKQHGKQVMEE